MPNQITAIRVFVASPSDVLPERRLLQEVLEEINTSIGHRKLRFEYVGWEQAYPGMGRVQEVINDQISPRDCDLFIGIMWSRFGTPTGEFGSGTEEEFQLAYESWQEKERPRIFFYFCDKNPAITTQEQWEQYRKVLAFREGLSKDKGLIWAYPGSEDFQRVVRRHLLRALADLVPQPLAGPTDNVATPTSNLDAATGASLDPPRRFTVFVASVGSGLEPFRAGLIEQLILHEVDVFRPQADPEVNRALMAQAHVCIHLLDGSAHPVVDRQLDESCAHGQRQLLWLSQRIELSPQDPDPHRRRLFALQSREGNFDFMRGRYADAVKEILERVDRLRQEWLQRRGEGIYFNTHGSDKSLAQEVFNYLLEKQVEALMNTDDLGEPLQALQEFDANARRSRAIVVFFGAVNAAWVAARLVEIMKLVLSRNYSVDKLAVYAAPPPSENKKVRIRLPGGLVPIWMDNTKGFDPQTLDDLF